MSARLITITLNPAIDQTVRLNRLEPGAVHRALGEQTEAGGKGLGVAAVLAALGRPVTASGWLGADNDAVFRTAFATHGIADAMVRLPGATRTNIKLAVAERGDSTDINLPGLSLPPDALQAAEQDLEAIDREVRRLGGETVPLRVRWASEEGDLRLQLLWDGHPVQEASSGERVAAWALLRAVVLDRAGLKRPWLLVDDAQDWSEGFGFLAGFARVVEFHTEVADG